MNADETQYIANEDHYEKVIEKIKDCKKTLWIGTADIKDLYVKDGRSTKPLLEVLSDLAKAKVAIGFKSLYRIFKNINLVQTVYVAPNKTVRRKFVDYSTQI